MPDDYDFVVLGAGNAGLGAADVVRKAGQRVLVVESRDVGGTCPLRGCVPKKVLVAAAEVLETISRAKAHGIEVGAPRLDWAKLIDRERSFVEGVPEDLERGLRAEGIDVLHGRARFVGRNALEVAGRRINGKQILVSTGSVPRPLDLEGASHLITSEDLLMRRERPASLIFIGAGVIAFEFTHVLARAGTKVTLLEVADRALPAMDSDAVAQLVAATRELGVEIHTSVKPLAVSPDGGGFAVRFEKDGREEVLRAESVAHGAGRVPDLEGMDLEAGGIEHEGHRISLDAFRRSTSNPGVWAAGDAAGPPQLSPVATYEGRLIGRNVVGGARERPDLASIPRVVFAVPALAQVGITEAVARERGLDFEAKVSRMADWRSGRTYVERFAWAKVISERASGKLLGAHLFDHGAKEVIHAFAFAMKHGLKASELAEEVYAYPTFHSDLKYLV